MLPFFRSIITCTGWYWFHLFLLCEHSLFDKCKGSTILAGNWPAFANHLTLIFILSILIAIF
jgi:hypothetical protein